MSQTSKLGVMGLNDFLLWEGRMGCQNWVWSKYICLSVRLGINQPVSCYHPWVFWPAASWAHPSLNKNMCVPFANLPSTYQSARLPVWVVRLNWGCRRVRTVLLSFFPPEGAVLVQKSELEPVNNIISTCWGLPIVGLGHWELETFGPRWTDHVSRIL
jgi:hypothetical protein